MTRLPESALPSSVRALGSDGERALDAQLRMMGHKGYQREFRFDGVRGWRFDFAWPEEQIAVEVEGGTWSQGRHTTGTGFLADCRKYNEAAILGWLVLRVPTELVDSGEAISLIGRALWSRSGRR